jgi:hypothetical protein
LSNVIFFFISEPFIEKLENMENFNQTFTLLDANISLNLDILETGLFNILALIALLVYTGRDFFRIFTRRTQNNDFKQCSGC